MTTPAASWPSLDNELSAIVGAEQVARDAPLAPLTTFRVGGRADLLVEARSAREVVAVLRLAHARGVRVAILGGGSNVLIADAGVRGIVLRPRHGAIDQLSASLVRAEAAVTINGLVRWLIARGLAGLEAWAGTPGTLGGAVHGNAHFQGRLLSEHVVSVRLASRAGEVAEVPASAMEFGYDRSRLQRTGEVVLSADLRVAAGDPMELRRTARESLHFRKRTQPLHMPSAGCIFQNPPPDVPMPPGVPRSAGALIDRAGLKGRRIGGARVSTHHGNFIVNDGTATASEIRGLVALCRDEVRRTQGVTLTEEIVYLGEFAAPA